MARTYTCKKCGMINPNWKCKQCAGENKPRHRTKFEHARFIAVDGEGVSRRDGTQDYTLLAVAGPNGTEGIENYAKGGLSTAQCLDFLLAKQKEYPDDLFVVYGGSYDMNMILGNVTPEQLLDIWEKRDDMTRYSPILDGTYEVSYMPRKFMKIRRVNNEKGHRFHETGRTLPNGKPEYRRTLVDDQSLTIWDVTGFFQSKFVDALEGYKIASPSLIAEMKERRGTFTNKDARIMREYCYQECELLIQLMDALRNAMKDANLTVSRWDGAGAVASALMKREQVKQHMQVTPDSLMHAVRCAYSGGRIEMPRFGVIDQPIYQYDIQSAYPSAMVTLPSLADGIWRKAEIATDRMPFSLSHIEWALSTGDDPEDVTQEPMLNPFPYRTVTGRIYYPSRGKGWVWEPELTVALKHWPEGITILETYNFYPATDEKPFAFVPALFEERKRLKATGNMAEKAIKLAINSIYGKTAQQKGGRKDKDTGEIIRPPYFQLEWAGYTTSLTRARLYDAAMQSPEDIIALCTDGIFSLVPLDLDVSEGLGKWEQSAHTNGTFAQSGVYFLTEPDGTRIEHYRGFDKGTLDRKAIEDALNTGKESIKAKQTRFVTMGAALHTDLAHWRKWITKPKELALVPGGTKRMFGVKGWDADNYPIWQENTGIRRTVCGYCKEVDNGEESKPFAIEWLDGLENMPLAHREDRKLGDEWRHESDLTRDD